jgi:hypothetical protein
VTVHTGTLRRFLWDGETAVISLVRDDGNTVALMVHGAVAEKFIAQHVVLDMGQGRLEPIIGLRVVCEESARGIVTKMVLDPDPREHEGKPFLPAVL